MKNYIPCTICRKKATWSYMPGREDYCDDCLPRGCSCNEDSDGSQPLDEKGRLYPCCEYMTIDPERHDDKERVAFGWETYYELHPEERRESDEVEHWEKKLGVDKE